MSNKFLILLNFTLFSFAFSQNNTGNHVFDMKQEIADNLLKNKEKNIHKIPEAVLKEMSKQRSANTPRGGWVKWTAFHSETQKASTKLQAYKALLADAKIPDANNEKTIEFFTQKFNSVTRNLFSNLYSGMASTQSLLRVKSVNELDSRIENIKKASNSAIATALLIRVKKNPSRSEREFANQIINQMITLTEECDALADIYDNPAIDQLEVNNQTFRVIQTMEAPMNYLIGDFSNSDKIL